MPYDIRPVEYKSILTYEEITRLVRVAARLGVRKIRLTGGEPLARKNIQFLIREIGSIEEIDEITLTTNGVLLERYAEELKEAGLNRVNVSLDSLSPEKYSKITGGGDIETVLRGIEKAHQLGLKPIRLNVVIIRGLNDDEVEDFALLTKNKDYHVRFIEFMPGRGNNWTEDRCVSAKEIRERLKKLGPLQPVRFRKNGSARYYRLPNSKGLIGFISPVTDHFCGYCNRLRITSDGKIRPCLFSETEIDLRTPLRNGASDGEIERLLRLAVQLKPEGHRIGIEPGHHINRPMSKIGG
jgi:cyclic pyranopterin phosphate synthase